MNKQIICCYSVVVVDKYGSERYFHVRMSYLSTFIKRFVKNGTILSILGRVQEDAWDEIAFHTFVFSEHLPF
nr:MAG TPA: hypothetical protein [Bacteriophage sp.]